MNPAMYTAEEEIAVIDAFVLKEDENGCDPSLPRSLPVHSIVLVAEYTTNEGPHAS